ncbi:MAG: HEAT repeat domain-containing protein [Paenibacillus lautus]|uniref:HEAT repeat domain-containing protein n=1 Tax=Paenibacillus lautus TaxID=1401 RepID=UPI0026EB5D69|nr:HEAT repeat domain-containing protein [Paenibacillus lautus]MCI1773298.1 HEAT repeat domain-containing protein [Paenibacillus lautus]
MLDSQWLLTDEQISQFIMKGYVVLHNELPDRLHAEVRDKINAVLHEEGNPGNNILPRVPEIQQFFETPVVKGALTSVLGPDYYMHPHRHCHYNQPGDPLPGGGQWHKDGYWSSMRSHRPWWAMIFYYMQDISEDMGPTAIMPGTAYYDKFVGDQGETILPTGKAGTMVLVHFDLWHKASLNVSGLDRYMLKFQFVRLRAPESPSWNHLGTEMHLTGGTPYVHLNLWRDVWNWMRGEPGQENLSATGEEAAIEPLAEELKSEDEVIRAKAADQVGMLGEKAASLAPELGRMLNDKEPVALNAGYALGRLGSAGTDELLRLMSEGTRQIAERAAYGLQSADAEAVPGLLALLEHTDEKRRALAAFALGAIVPSTREVAAALIACLQDPSDWVRRNAIEALGMMGREPEAGEVCRALANILEESILQEGDGTAETRNNDITQQSYILNKLGYTAALSLLRTASPEDVPIVIHSLEQALHSKDRYVRAYAFETLTHLRTPEAMDVLIRYYRPARWCPDTTKASTF